MNGDGQSRDGRLPHNRPANLRQTVRRSCRRHHRSGALSAVREEFDVVIQCASSGGGAAEEYRRIYLEGARNLLRVFPGTRLLFTSSTSVYAQQHGDIVDETSPANPSHEKGQILRQAEEIVLSHNGMWRGWEDYGPGRSFFCARFSQVMQCSIKRRRFINKAHRDDIVSGLVLLADRGADLGGQIYNVVDDQPILARDAYQWLSAHLQRPLPAGKVAATRKRGEGNKQVSNKKLRALGWEPRYPNFVVGMTESVLPSFGFEL